jgi:hypothetical protein
MNRRSTRLRNKERQTVALTEPSERKSRHGRKLMPSKRMVDIKVSAENDDSPPLSSLANSANGNQTKNEKPKRRKSKVKRRFYAGEPFVVLENSFFFNEGEPISFHYSLVFLPLACCTFVTLICRCIVNFIRQCFSSVIYYK